MLSNFDLSARFFLQLAFILLVCRGTGWIARRVGQPQVIGEMIAGVLMGPSLLGLLWPEAQAWLFPSQSLSILFAVSQIGMSLYMFLMGLEFNRGLFRGNLHGAVSVSAAGMLAPFVLGALIGWGLSGEPGFFGEKAHASDAALFMGAAMAITAFPTLARILYEKGLSGTTLGTLTLAAGAIDDAAAWCVLAVVLASFDHDWGIAVRAIGGAAGYAVVVLTLGRLWLQPLNRVVERAGAITEPLLAMVLSLLMLGSWFTDIIGVYSVFGAFILGVAMPRGRFADEIRRMIEPITLVFLLPLFFTYSGLNTRLDLVNSWSLGLVGLLILAAACLGKGGACYAAARWSGENTRTALAVGTLMNARGLMELIILNIGLHRGIIQPPLFTIMVLMAVATTLMAGPCFEWFYGRHSRAAGLQN